MTLEVNHKKIKNVSKTNRAKKNIYTNLTYYYIDFEVSASLFVPVEKTK